MHFKGTTCYFIAVLATLLVTLQIAGQAKSKSYYVNDSGNDENKGTKNEPFKTIQRVNKIHFTAGDTLFFQSGQSFNGSLLIARGTAGFKKRPIVITSCGNGRAIIDGKDSFGIGVYGSSFIKVQQLQIIGSGRKTGNTKDGVLVYESKEVTIDEVEITGFQKSGLLVYASQRVLINNVSVHDNGAAGITVEGPYQKRDSREIQILNCRAENNPGDPTKLDNHSGNGIVVGNCRQVLIDHCTATNNGWDMPRIGNGPVGIWAYEADSVIIQHCLAYRNKTSVGGADGGGFDFDGGVTNSIIQYCFSYENQGSGYCIFQYWGAGPWYNNIYRYNISENDGTVSDSQAGLYIWNSSNDEKQFYNCEVYANIIYNSRVAAVSFSETSRCKGFHFYNNIFVARDSLIKGSDNIGNAIFRGNDWWSLEQGFNIGGTKDLEEWSKASRQESVDGRLVGFNEDPKLKKPGNSSFTSATQLRTMSNYKFPQNSELKKKLKLDHSVWY